MLPSIVEVRGNRGHGQLDKDLVFARGVNRLAHVPMAAWSGKRREPRAGYRATVELVPFGADAAPGLRGDAINVSAGGILVRVPAALPVGAHVVCHLPLPGGVRALRGRVARLQPLSAAEDGDVGLGIAFVDPPAADRAALRCLVAERREGLQAVTVRFQGTNRAVQSSARVTESGFRLTTPLPFLKRESTVDVAVSPDTPLVTRGVVRRVELAGGDGGSDDVPRLIIHVGVAKPRTGRARRWAIVVLAAAAVAAAVVEALRIFVLGR
jgi:hypothetical protein